MPCKKPKPPWTANCAIESSSFRILREKFCLSQRLWEIFCDRREPKANAVQHTGENLHTTCYNIRMPRHDYAPRPAHLRWLLDSDPAIRWQAMREDRKSVV